MDSAKVESAKSKFQAKGSPFNAQFINWAELQSNSTWTGAFNAVFAHADLDQRLFESEHSVATFVATVAALLKPGGFFVGNFLDSAEIFRHLVKHSQHGKTSFSTTKGLLSIQFDPTVASGLLSFGGRAKVYGVPFSATMEEDVQKMYLINTASFIHQASKVGLELVDMPNSAEFFEEAKRNHPDLKKMIPSAKQPSNQPKTSLYVLPEQKEVLCTHLERSQTRFFIY